MMGRKYIIFVMAKNIKLFVKKMDKQNLKK